MKVISMTDHMVTMDKATAASILAIPQNASAHDIEDAYARMCAILSDDGVAIGRRRILDMARAVMLDDDFDVIGADGKPVDNTNAANASGRCDTVGDREDIGFDAVGFDPVDVGFDRKRDGKSDKASRKSGGNGKSTGIFAHIAALIASLKASVMSLVGAKAKSDAASASAAAATASVAADAAVNAGRKAAGFARKALDSSVSAAKGAYQRAAEQREIDKRRAAASSNGTGSGCADHTGACDATASMPHVNPDMSNPYESMPPQYDSEEHGPLYWVAAKFPYKTAFVVYALYTMIDVYAACAQNPADVDFYGFMGSLIWSVLMLFLAVVNSLPIISGIITNFIRKVMMRVAEFIEGLYFKARSM